MQDIKKIIKLLNEKKFEKAEEILLKWRKSDYKNEKINYFLGELYSDYRFTNRSDQKAKRYFKYAIESKNPIENAYLKLSYLEKNPNHPLRILKKGLEKFPNSIELYENILWRSEISERELIFEEIENKRLFSNEISIIKLETYIALKKYKKALQITENIKANDTIEKKILKIMKAFIFFEIDNLTESKEIFVELINEDINHELNYSPYFGLILLYLKEHKVEEAVETFLEIPNETEIEMFVLPASYHLVFDFENYFIRSLFRLEENVKDKKLLGKIRGIRGLALFAKHFDSEINSEIVKDLKYANKIFPGSLKYFEALDEILGRKQKYFEAYKLLIQLIENLSVVKEEYFGSFYFIIESDNASFNLIITDIFEILSKKILSTNKKIATTILKPIVERLFKEERFSEIVELSKLFDVEIIKNLDIIFEIAYSFSEENYIKEAKNFYNFYIEKEGMVSSVANNLGLIYEEEGDLRKAKELFEKPLEIDKSNEKSKKNLARILKLLEGQNKELLELITGSNNFEKENSWIQSKILSFSKHRDVNGFIICSYKQLPEFLNVTPFKANDLIKSFLEKKYLLKIKNHNLNTLSSVYKINPEIGKKLKIIERSVKKDKELLELAEKLNSNNLAEIGYDENLIKSIKKISSKDLQIMLKRDLKENALALMTKSHKTALVLSGSIIEAILLYKILNNNLKKYTLENGKNKKIIRMDLNELLYVAFKEKIIDEQLFHLAHALRGFRNLIHPGVENRKKAIQISKLNSNMAWDITRKILLDI